MAPKETAYYDLLGVSPTATPAEIRKAFRLLALKHHPDRAGNTKEATDFFTRLRAVYDLLLDPERREDYDAHGDTGTLHGGDPNVDVDALSAFFASAGARLSEDEIRKYEREYRDGNDEREDLVDFYNRFQGNVKRVLDYIPYSDESDLLRFVTFWDEKIDAAELDKQDAYARARKSLLKKGKGLERDLNADAELQQLAAEDDQADSKPKKRKRKESQPDADLFNQILARRQNSKNNFDKWAAGIAERAEREANEKKAKSAARKKAKKARSKEQKASS